MGGFSGYGKLLDGFIHLANTTLENLITTVTIHSCNLEEYASIILQYPITLTYICRGFRRFLLVNVQIVHSATPETFPSIRLTSDMCSRASRFQYRLQNRISSLNILVLLSPTEEMPREYHKIGHESILACLSEFIK